MAEGKWIPGLHADTPLADAGRRVLAARLEVVRDALPPAVNRPDEDPEYVHQLRVATRRAGAAVEIFAGCLPEKAYRKARKQLRRVRRGIGVRLRLHHRFAAAGRQGNRAMGDRAAPADWREL